MIKQTTINRLHDLRLSPMADAFEEFKKEFCKKTLITLYLNNFDRKALVTDEDGSTIGVLEGGIRTLLKDGVLTVAKDGQVLSDEKNVFIPALWNGENSIVAYSEDGITEKTWIIPDGVRLSGKAKGWILDASGRQEFNDFKVSRGKVTITLKPGQMVLITN